MYVTENSDSIIIRHTPWKSWILGGSLTLFFGGISVWLVLSIVFRPQIPFAFGMENPSDLLTLHLLATVVVAFVIYPFVSAPQINLIISRRTKSVDVLRRRIYRAQTKRFHFYQVEKFKSYKGKTRFSSAYSLALVLSNRKTLKLQIPIGADKNGTVKFIKKLNKFIKQSPKDPFIEYVSSQNSSS